MTFTARLLLIFVACTLAAQAPAPPDPFAVPNAFAAAYAEWGRHYVARVNALGPAGFDAGEKRAFDRLSDRWQDLRRSMRLQYAQ